MSILRKKERFFLYSFSFVFLLLFLSGNLWIVRFNSFTNIQGLQGLYSQKRSDYQKAKYAFSLGDWKRAFSLFEKAKRKDPKNGKYYFYTGYVLEKQKKHPEAMVHYQKALKLKLEKKLKQKTFWKLCLYYKRVHDWENLLKYTKVFLVFFPHRSVQKMHDLARKNHDPKKVNNRILFEKVVDLLEDIKGSQAENKDYQEIINLLERIVISDPSHSKARWELVLLKMKIRDFASAIKHLGVLLYEEPNSWEYKYKIGVCYYRIKMYEKALPHLKQAQLLYSGDNASFDFYMAFMLGNIYMEKGDEKLALHYLHKAEKKRKLSSIDASLSRVYWFLRNKKKATFYAERSITIRRDADSREVNQQAIAYSILALLAWINGKEKIAYERATRMHSLIKSYRGSFLNKSESSFQKKIRGNTLYNATILLLIRFATDNQNWKKATRFFTQIDQASIIDIQNSRIYEEIKELSKHFWYNYAYTLMKKGDLKNALARYENLKSNSKLHIQVLFDQARCYALLSRAKKSEYYLRRILDATSEKKIPLWRKRVLDDEAFQELAEQDVDFEAFIQREF